MEDINEVEIEWNFLYNRWLWTIDRNINGARVIDAGTARTRIGARFAAWRAYRNLEN